MLTAPFGDLPSVDASGQLDVRDENVDDPSPAPRQRILAIGRITQTKGGTGCVRDHFNGSA
jgi:hypothetical protein